MQFHRMIVDTMNSRDKTRFEQSQKNDKHRRWCHDVIELFADKIHLDKCQAGQLLITKEPHRAGSIYHRRTLKLPELIIVTNNDGQPEKVQNPTWRLYKDLSEMQHEPYANFFRDQLGFALTLRHPDDKIPRDKPSDVALAHKIIKIASSRDESRAAHKERTQTALEKFREIWGNDTLTTDQMAALGDQLGLKQFPVN